MDDIREYFELDNLIEWGRDALIIAVALCLAKIAQVVVLKLVMRVRSLARNDLNQCLVDRIHRPLLFLFALIAISAAIPLTQLPEEWIERLQTILKPLSVASFGWLIAGLVQGTGRWLEKRYALEASRDSLHARRFTTQIHLLMRVVIAIVIALTVIGMALVIPALREFGMSLFASAGVAGIVIGIAANTTLSNLIAGVQLALTQQILLGDEVVVQDEFGTIEEINASYVVVRLWDLRRLIIPLRYFMENPFENWTYHEPDVMGTVYIYTDYLVDVDAVRAEAERIVKASPRWDGKRCELLVTDSKEQNVELRVSMSAKDSSALWDLRCEVREKLLTYLQHEQTSALPRHRIIVKEASEQTQEPENA